MNSIQQIRTLFKSGEAEAGLDMAASLLRMGELAPEMLSTMGKLIAPALSEKEECRSALILGQFTTTWLAETLAAAAWTRTFPLRIRESEYDVVYQSLLTDSEPTDYFILAPWNKRLLAKTDDLEKNLENELDFWTGCWKIIEDRGGAILQIGYDYMGPGATGYLCDSEGTIRTVRRMNELLRRHLPKGACFVDLEAVSGEMGRREFYDPRRYYWTKQPMSPAGIALLAKHLDAAVRTLTTGSKKVLVLDLDNTLWGGVVGDLGPLDIDLGEEKEGEAYRDFQRYCKDLSNRGVLLAVASKNNEADAREPFEKNPNMILTLDDFAAFQSHWMPKSDSMRTIASELNLGPDSLVFFDDNPAEREEVRQNAPGVAVIEVPEDVSKYVSAVEESLYFETLSVTREDLDRTRQYRTETRRRESVKSFSNLDDYLKSLEMIGHVGTIDDGCMQRIVQLIGKTNQFNLTTRRHGESTVRKYVNLPGAVVPVLELSDKFGDHGLIAVAIGLPSSACEEERLRRAAGNDGLVIDTMLMSCRVINRTVEHFFMNVLIDGAGKIGYRRIVGQYVKTAKNVIVADYYSKMGFSTVEFSEEEGIYFLELPARKIETFVCQPYRSTTSSTLQHRSAL